MEGVHRPRWMHRAGPTRCARTRAATDCAVIAIGISGMWPPAVDGSAAARSGASQEQVKSREVVCGLGGLVGVGTGEQGESEIAAASDLLVALLGPARLRRVGSTRCGQGRNPRTTTGPAPAGSRTPDAHLWLPISTIRRSAADRRGHGSDGSARFRRLQGDRRGRDWSPWAARNRFPIGQLRDDTKMAAVRRHENVRKARSVLGHSSQLRLPSGMSVAIPVSMSVPPTS
ncbi:hypothetical protein Rruber_05608 (plasmid) [Rhodococcus ruber]